MPQPHRLLDEAATTALGSADLTGGVEENNFTVFRGKSSRGEMSSGATGDALCLLEEGLRKERAKEGEWRNEHRVSIC